MDYATVWKKADSSRQRLEPTGTRIFSTAIHKAIRPAIESIDTYGFASDAALLAPERIKREEIEAGYIALYGLVLPMFARRVLNQFKAEINKDRGEQEWQEYVNTYIGRDIANRVTGVTDTLRDKIRELINKGIEEGLSVEQIKRDLDRLGLARVINNRSRVIARTEIISASNKGNLMGAQETGLDLDKVWITSIDGRERDAHLLANGQTVDLNDGFTVDGQSLQYPGDPNGRADNVINCRCVEAFIPK